MLHLWELSNGGYFGVADEEGQRVDKEMRAVALDQSTKYISFIIIIITTIPECWLRPSSSIRCTRPANSSNLKENGT